jgi:ATP-dependent DNA helicase PIF1
VYVRKARQKLLQPFGGIQLIFVGDFAQLGPIPGRTSLKNKAFHPTEDGADCILDIAECAGYAFQTVLWREADFHHVHLRKVYRQSDENFVKALMDIREAKPSTTLVQNLISRCSTPLESREELDMPEGIKPTILYCTNRNVDRENSENLNKLQTLGKAFQAKDTVKVFESITGPVRDSVERILQNSSFFKDCTASSVIHLKIGAQVMLLQNLGKGDFVERGRENNFNGSF